MKERPPTADRRYSLQSDGGLWSAVANAARKEDKQLAWARELPFNVSDRIFVLTFLFAPR